MPSINTRQLRDTPRLKAWLRAGKTVELRERNRLIGRIVPEAPAVATRRWPDFATRRRKMFGDRLLPGADLLMRSASGHAIERLLARRHAARLGSRTLDALHVACALELKAGNASGRLTTGRRNWREPKA